VRPLAAIGDDASTLVLMHDRGISDDRRLPTGRSLPVEIRMAPPASASRRRCRYHFL
jgi:hypothetical protein